MRNAEECKLEVFDLVRGKTIIRRVYVNRRWCDRWYDSYRKNYYGDTERYVVKRFQRDSDLDWELIVSVDSDDKAVI